MQDHTQEPTCYYFHVAIVRNPLFDIRILSSIQLSLTVTFCEATLFRHTWGLHYTVIEKRGKVVAGEKALIKAMSCPLLINLMASAGPLSLRTTLVKLKEYVPEVEVVVYVGKQIWWDEASREYTSRERCFRVVRIPRIQSDFL